MKSDTDTRWEIALTGGIACGKSTVAEMLRARGWHVIVHRFDLPAGARSGRGDLYRV